MVFDSCKQNKRGKSNHPNGWVIHEHSQYSYDKYYPADRELPPIMRVCSPCEKRIGDANMAFAGYRKTNKGVWTR